MIPVVDPTYDLSAQALKPLMDAFWEAAGWRETPAWPDPAAMAGAVAAGVMFSAPRTDDHDGWVAAARLAARWLSPAEVGEAFLASLTSRRLDLRSAVGSYAVARFLPERPFTAASDNVICAICSQHD